MNCLTKGCSTQPGIKKGGYCYRCAKQREKHRNPMQYAYNFHRYNAKKRGIDFLLSFAEFKEFWQQNQEHWIAKKANILKADPAKVKNRQCLYEIDRIDPGKGYQVGNIRCLPKSINAVRYWHAQTRENYWTVTVEKENVTYVAYQQEVPEVEETETDFKLW